MKTTASGMGLCKCLSQERLLGEIIPESYRVDESVERVSDERSIRRSMHESLITDH